MYDAIYSYGCEPAKWCRSVVIRLHLQHTTKICTHVNSICDDRAKLELKPPSDYQLHRGGGLESPQLTQTLLYPLPPYHNHLTNYPINSLHLPSLHSLSLPSPSPSPPPTAIVYIHLTHSYPCTCFPDTSPLLRGTYHCTQSVRELLQERLDQ